MAGTGARPDLPGVEEEAGDGLLFRRIAAGTVLWRIHRAGQGAIFFGDAAIDYRFNDPGPGASHPEAPGPYDSSAPDEGAYGVCYLGFSSETAFVETFLRRPARRDIARAEIDARRLTPVRASRDLRLVQLDGPGLRRARVDGAVVGGRDYALSRAVSRLLWRRGDAPDGILYAARHDNHLYAAAVFDRAETSLAAGSPGTIGDDLLRELIGRYRFGLL
jgi:hypothetical protein